MLHFGNKDVTERLRRVVAFGQRMEPGETITGVTVSVDMAPETRAIDPSPATLLDGAGSINPDDLLVNIMEGDEVAGTALLASGQAYVQWLNLGVAGGIYLMKFVATTSLGQKITARVTQQVLD